MEERQKNIDNLVDKLEKFISDKRDEKKEDERLVSSSDFMMFKDSSGDNIIVQVDIVNKKIYVYQTDGWLHENKLNHIMTLIIKDIYCSVYYAKIIVRGLY